MTKKTHVPMYDVSQESHIPCTVNIVHLYSNDVWVKEVLMRVFLYFSTCFLFWSFNTLRCLSGVYVQYTEYSFSIDQWLNVVQTATLKLVISWVESVKTCYKLFWHTGWYCPDWKLWKLCVFAWSLHVHIRVWNSTALCIMPVLSIYNI